MAARVQLGPGCRLGPGAHILFLILPFLEGAPRPKAPCCSSRARRRLRAESCLRPPRCRKRIFCARRLCFRICCLVLSSERTRPVGAPGARGWEAPARRGGGGWASGSTARVPAPSSLLLLCSCCGPQRLHAGGTSRGGKGRGRDRKVSREREEGRGARGGAVWQETSAASLRPPALVPGSPRQEGRQRPGPPGCGR